jgi:hypothetical protein
MMCLDVEGCANIFKLSKGAPEKLNDEISVVEERLLPLLQRLPTAAFVVIVLPSSPLQWRRAP